MNKVIAIFCADLHLSHRPPVARSAEPDWYEAQGRYLKQLSKLAVDLKTDIFCAGDVFDRWNSPPELINWALDNLPLMYCIPGQHDMPHHNIDDLKSSAYWTVAWVEEITSIGAGRYGRDKRLMVHGFPWGKPLYQLEGREDFPNDDSIYVALVHQYIWVSGSEHPGASDDSHASKLAEQLEGFDVAVFGDNHRPFTAKVGSCTVFNCGCLIPRSMDERSHRPSVGLLHEDGTIERHFLDTSQDRWLEGSDPRIWQGEETEKINRFLDDLKSMGNTALDFHRAVLRYMEMNHVDDGVRQALLEALETNGP